MNKIEIFEKQVDECNKIIDTVKEIKENAQKEIAELKQKEQWKPETNEKYWYYERDWETVKDALWFDDNNDNIRLKNKVVFETKEEAERYANYQKAKEEYTYEFSKKEWKNIEISKFAIIYNHKHKKLDICEYYYTESLGNSYFNTKQQAQEFIDKYKNEILEYEFGIVED